MSRLTTIFLLLPLIFLSCKNADISIYDYTQECYIKENVTSLHVFLIGIDGWGAYSMPKANMPTIKRMMANGAYTLSAKAVFPSVSAPNWVSMFTGSNPVFHGYTRNSGRIPTFQPVIVDEYNYYPNIFTLIRKLHPNCKIASFYEWDGIEDFYPSSVTDKHQNISDLSSDPNAINVITEYIKTIKDEPLTFTFIHFDGADHAGHSAGHNTPEYYAMLTHIDGLIKKIEDEVVADSMIAETVFIFSADHGGINKGHGGNTQEERDIPIIICGKNIKNGYVITGSLNIYDIMPTVSALFGISKPSVSMGNSFYDIVKK